LFFQAGATFQCLNDLAKIGIGAGISAVSYQPSAFSKEFFADI